MIPQLESSFKTPVQLRDRYDFDCVQCGAVQSAEPSINMLAGVNSACVMCLRCKTVLHVTIVPDLGGDTAVSELQSDYVARKR